MGQRDPIPVELARQPQTLSGTSTGRGLIGLKYLNSVMGIGFARRFPSVAIDEFLQYN
jgi:hypothetical protein